MLQLTLKKISSGVSVDLELVNTSHFSSAEGKIDFDVNNLKIDQLEGRYAVMKKTSGGGKVRDIERHCRAKEFVCLREANRGSMARKISLMKNRGWRVIGLGDTRAIEYLPESSVRSFGEYKLSAGSILDCRDKAGMWLRAKILKTEKKDKLSFVNVHFSGFDTTHDEWIDITHTERFAQRFRFSHAGERDAADHIEFQPGDKVMVWTPRRYAGGKKGKWVFGQVLKSYLDHAFVFAPKAKFKYWFHVLSGEIFHRDEFRHDNKSIDCSSPVGSVNKQTSLTVTKETGVEDKRNLPSEVLISSSHSTIGAKTSGFCDHCGTGHAPGVIYCIRCGSNITLSKTPTKKQPSCSSCDMISKVVGAQFCSRCGETLGSPKPTKLYVKKRRSKENSKNVIKRQNLKIEEKCYENVHSSSSSDDDDSNIYSSQEFWQSNENIKKEDETRSKEAAEGMFTRMRRLLVNDAKSRNVENSPNTQRSVESLIKTLEAKRDRRGRQTGTKSNGTEGVIFPTVGDGDCGIHAMLGRMDISRGMYFCPFAKEIRMRLVSCIRACGKDKRNLFSEAKDVKPSGKRKEEMDMSPTKHFSIRNLALKSIREIAMNSTLKGLGENIESLRKDYVSFEADVRLSQSEASAVLSRALSRRPDIVEFLKNNAPDKKSTIYYQFHSVRNSNEVEIRKRLEERIKLEKELKELVDNLDEISLVEYDWEAKIKRCHFGEYANYLQRGCHLSVDELNMLAILYDIAVVFNCAIGSSKDVLNPKGKKRVGVSFNGINHF
eukprot:CAMPEP_0167756340 /NCGR_PEP_ID=MMETSP0110_2-20121227/9331_1 /TAXON_ID=629695 /ORGANISM="Gymnochlora sp., Strain CCMP2014" /LENGTH=773 /DNA_ID=CAMNT_0007642439 /DNA_START=628 /DNA_END=2946 /DNA_ORIENTATION=-